MFRQSRTFLSVDQSAAGSLPPAILFCGKHRVNFAMFDSVYQALRRDPEVRILLSSGRYRWRPFVGWINPREPELRNEALFGEFDIDPASFHKTSIRDHERRYAVYVSSNVDAKMQPRNCGAAVQIFQGVSFRNYAVDPKYLRFDKLFFPGRYMLEQYIAKGILKEGDSRIELIGLPKLDRLANGAFQREAVLAQYGLDPARPTILWCPTGARYNSFEKLGQGGIRAIEAAGCNLILKLHDHPHLPKGMTPADVLNHARAAMGKNSRLSEHSDVTPLLAAADLLVTDASSVAFEYCLLDRPIVFVDVPELLGARAAMEGSAMDLNTHGRKMGRIVSGAEELTEALAEELRNPGRFSPQRKAAASHLFHDPGRATERAARKLKELALANG